MKNILSIDLDVLFPTLDKQIERFKIDNFMQEPYMKFWNTVEYGGVSVDYHLSNVPYFLIMDILVWIDLFKSNAHIHVIENHQEILDIVGNEKCNLINFDQHHDIYYTEYSKECALSGNRDNISEGNWVLYLYRKGLLKSYSWVTNKTADFSFDHLVYPFSFYIERDWRNGDEYGIKSELKKKFESDWFTDIVFCRSPFYCPPTAKVKKILEKIKNKNNYIQL